MTSEPVPVTREGLERLKDELDNLKNVRRPEIAAESWPKPARMAICARTPLTTPRDTIR